MLQVLDPRLEDQYSVRAAQKACSLAYYCLSHNPKARPLMSDVVETLQPLQASSSSESSFQALGSSVLPDRRVHRRLAGSSISCKPTPNAQCSPGALPACRVNLQLSKPRTHEVAGLIFRAFELSAKATVLESHSPQHSIIFRGTKAGELLDAERMSRVHPALRKTDDEEPATTTDRPSVWTVWNKSSMGFHGTDGFSIYDSQGRLAFRVDNYSRKHKCFAGQLLLMDANGKALMALRPQILSMHDRWSGFKGEDGSDPKCRTHVFSMKRRSILQGCDKAEVYMDGPKDRSSLPHFRTRGCFRRRDCKILDSNGEEVAQISHKKVNRSVTLGDDVFSLIIQPYTDTELIMAFLVIMDRIC
ncbi:hypothetical protein MUK42_12516 [Musa troglodytarum]|uniref:Uncharacterized protein n=1 Tax=Musa troglodytarum TaxID=320322 RepID=A0A9E7GZG0_9LILI|nr:hypothetical protein MUK42_12516 [Musa troglodytarum]